MRIISIVVILVALAVSLVAWTTSSATLATNITAGGNAGKLAEVTPIGETFNLNPDKGAKVTNVGLYKIELGSVQFSNRAKIELMILNTEEPEIILDSPYTNIKVQLYYPGTGHGSIVLDSDGQTLIPDPGPKAKGMINRGHANIILQPSVSGQTTFYIVADLQSPPGQSNKNPPSNLTYYVKVWL